MTTKEIGDMGETAACRYLESKGYTILERNFKIKTGEIDIIAKDGECIVFTEVKTRKNTLYGEPSECVDFRKQRRITRTAMYYTDTVNNEIRFDVIEVLYKMTGGKAVITSVNHIENAF